jgi:hypothetical protein
MRLRVAPIRTHRERSGVLNVISSLPIFPERRYSMSKETSPKAAKAASKTLRDGRTAKASKTSAGSALSQREK